MTLLQPFGRWCDSLLNVLECGRLRRVRKRSFSPIQCGLEGLELRVLLAAVVQFDVSSVLNADVVANKPANSPVDTTQTPVDRNIGGGDRSMLPQSAADALKPASAPDADGRPDHGVFSPAPFHPHP